MKTVGGRFVSKTALRAPTETRLTFGSPRGAQFPSALRGSRGPRETEFLGDSRMLLFKPLSRQGEGFGEREDLDSYRLSLRRRCRRDRRDRVAAGASVSRIGWPCRSRHVDARSRAA